jgi:hypothetical protein
VKILVAALLGGICSFAWNAAAHMATPLGTQGIKDLPAEPIVLTAMSAALKEPGLYMFPGGGEEAMKTPEGEAAYAKKVTDGPSGVLVFRPANGTVFGPKVMAIEFLINVACAAVIAMVLAMGRFPNFAARFLAGGLLGAYGSISIYGSFTLWYGYPSEYTVAGAIMEVVAGFAAAIPAAVMIKPRG